MLVDKILIGKSKLRCATIDQSIHFYITGKVLNYEMFSVKFSFFNCYIRQRQLRFREQLLL